MIVSSTCYQRPSYGLSLLVASPLGLVSTALPWEWPVLAFMATYCLFLARAHIGSESARRRWVGGNWCASQPSHAWCFLRATAAVGGLEGSLERVLGQWKACSCSRICCNHYTAPLGTPVTPGDTTGHAVSWSQVSIRPPLNIRMVSVLPLVLALSTQPLGSKGEGMGVDRRSTTPHASNRAIRRFALG
jgi:hypothetical protein